MKITHAFAVFAAAVCLIGTVTAAEPDSATAPTTANAAKTTETYVPAPQEKAVWDKLLQQGVETIAFVKRFTYNSNHYYTEYLNSQWLPGGNLCTLNLRTGEVKELVLSLTGGVFGAFDVSFDAKRLVFAYKAAKRTGYRLYEVNLDGTGLRQLTFSPPNEDELIAKYAIAGYSHATEDLDPCYLPDGGIAFVSTRCHFGTLCDAPDIFTTTVLYRIDKDGGNMRQLSNSSVSEHTPSIMPDGRILYTRWEYVDKGAVAVKCLWAMQPDGSNSVEIYGNDVAFPTTMVMGRSIPGSSTEYVFTGTPHCPQNCVGTIVRIDITKDIRTREPMTYMTPSVDVQAEAGFAFRTSPTGSWKHDPRGHGPLFRESFPLSRDEFLVSHKPAGPVWTDAKSYQLYLLKEGGEVTPVYSDKNISSFRPIPVVSRKVPPVIPSRLNPDLAGQNLAECIVTDVYKGMVGVAEGEVKYLRILEQVPRPWGARRYYGGDDEYDQQHAVVSKDTHLGLKIQHGIVTVEKDGSARFVVPAGRNIFMQALDAKFRAIQTERTYVNYMPGEVRSCVGCHESISQAPRPTGQATPLAMKRKAEVPYAQPGDPSAARTLSYARDVQPVFDKHCVNCHSGTDAPGKLVLVGTQTRLFNESYEVLVPERRRSPRRDRKLLGLVIGENHPKPGNIHYLPARSIGSYASVLVAMLDTDIKLADPAERKRAENLAKLHDGLELTREEKLKITNWVDTNCQYYGSYYGRRNIKYKDHPDYRKEYGVDVAISPEPPASYRRGN
ncbi:MAG: hypothetical protein LBV54_04830 [Puniceicoccales bacterium]|jgi:hypothetical protein|nr:hypothetical protein [Puniceicoccales bacterium]